MMQNMENNHLANFFNFNQEDMKNKFITISFLKIKSPMDCIEESKNILEILKTIEDKSLSFELLDRLKMLQEKMMYFTEILEDENLLKNIIEQIENISKIIDNYDDEYSF